jgi:hypothetical protein
MTLCGLKKWLTVAALAVLGVALVPAVGRCDDNGVFLYLIGLAQPPKPQVTKPIASPCCPHELCRGATTMPCCPMTMNVIVIRDMNHTPSAARCAMGCGMSAVRAQLCVGGTACCQQPDCATHAQAVGRFAGADNCASTCAGANACCSGRCASCPLCASQVNAAEELHRVGANQEQTLRELKAMLADLQREIATLRVELQVLRQQQPVIVPLIPQQNVPFFPLPNGQQLNFPPQMPGNVPMWNGPMAPPMPGAVTPMTPAPMNYAVPITSTTADPMNP